MTDLPSILKREPVYRGIGERQTPNANRLTPQMSGIERELITTCTSTNTSTPMLAGAVEHPECLQDANRGKISNSDVTIFYHFHRIP